MAQDDGRIPRGMALPRLDPDAVDEVRPPQRDAEPALALELPEVAASDHVRRRRPRGPMVAAALAAVVVVLGLGLVVPGLMGGDKARTSGLPAPGRPTAAAMTEAPTGTPSPSDQPKHTKGTKQAVAHVPGKATSTQTSTHGSGTTPAKVGGQPSSTPSTSRTTAKQVWGTTVVPATSVLKVGQNWHTNRIKLSLTTAGDAVLTDQNGKVTWTAGKSGGTALVFQGDGNLVLYQGDTMLWETGTAGNEDAKLVLQDDGNVTISQDGKFLWGAL